MKNKILTISIVFILISLTLISNVFAYTEDFEGEGITNTFFVYDEIYDQFIELDEYKSGNYNYLLVGSNGWYSIYFFNKTDDVKIWMTRTPYKSSFASNIKNYNCIWYKVKDDGSSLSKQTSTSLSEFYNSCYFEGNKYYMLTNVNIYSDSSCTDFFFEAPVTEQQEKGTLVPILEEVKMEPLREILTLVPIMIVLIVSYLGLSKGLTFIKTLRKM